MSKQDGDQMSEHEEQQNDTRPQYPVRLIRAVDPYTGMVVERFWLHMVEGTNTVGGNHGRQGP